jgi:hypothetical protein
MGLAMALQRCLLCGIVGTNFVFNGNTIDADISIVP